MLSAQHFQLVWQVQSGEELLEFFPVPPGRNVHLRQAKVVVQVLVLWSPTAYSPLKNQATV